MTDSKREARTWWLNFNARVDGTDAPPLVSKEYDHFGHNNVSVEVIEKSSYDSLLKENQELRGEERRMLARLHRQSAIMAEKDAEIARLREEIIQIIDKSGIEDIYNWGDPLRKIRKALDGKVTG